MRREFVPDSFAEVMCSDAFAVRRVDISRLGSGEPVRVSLDMPRTVVRGFSAAGGRARLEWVVEARVTIEHRDDLVLIVPLTASGVPSESTARGNSQPASVGTARKAAVWRLAGTNAGFQYVDNRLRAELEGAHVEIAREEHTTRARIVLEQPCPGLDCEVRGRRLQFTATDPDQAAHWKQISQRLPETPYQCEFTDGVLSVFARPGVGVEVGDLARFAHKVSTLASAISAAQASCPAPRFLARYTAAWSALAERHGGVFDAPRACLDISVERVAFAVKTEWDARGQPTHTTLVATLAHDVPPHYHMRWQRGQDDLAGLIAGVRELADLSDSLRIDARGIYAVGLPCFHDSEAVDSRLRALYTAASVLSRGEPYR